MPLAHSIGRVSHSPSNFPSYSKQQSNSQFHPYSRHISSHLPPGSSPGSSPDYSSGSMPPSHHLAHAAPARQSQSTLNSPIGSPSSSYQYDHLHWHSYPDLSGDAASDSAHGQFGSREFVNVTSSLKQASTLPASAYVWDVLDSGDQTSWSSPNFASFPEKSDSPPTSSSSSMNPSSLYHHSHTLSAATASSSSSSMLSNSSTSSLASAISVGTFTYSNLAQARDSRTRPGSEDYLHAGIVDDRDLDRRGLLDIHTRSSSRSSSPPRLQYPSSSPSSSSSSPSQLQSTPHSPPAASDVPNVVKQEEEPIDGFVFELPPSSFPPSRRNFQSPTSPASSAFVPSSAQIPCLTTTVPLRATQASKEMKKMMGAFRLNPFAVHNGVKISTGGGGEGGKGDGKGDGPCLTWLGEEVGPLKEEPVIIEFQLDWKMEEDSADEEMALDDDTSSGSYDVLHDTTGKKPATHSDSLLKRPLRRSTRHRASSSLLHPLPSRRHVSPLVPPSHLMDSPESILHSVEHDRETAWSTPSLEASQPSSLPFTSETVNLNDVHMQPPHYDADGRSHALSLGLDSPPSVPSPSSDYSDQRISHAQHDFLPSSSYLQPQRFTIPSPPASSRPSQFGSHTSAGAMTTIPNAPSAFNPEMGITPAQSLQWRMQTRPMDVSNSFNKDQRRLPFPSSHHSNRLPIPLLPIPPSPSPTLSLHSSASGGKTRQPSPTPWNSPHSHSQNTTSSLFSDFTDVDFFAPEPEGNGSGGGLMGTSSAPHTDWFRRNVNLRGSSVSSVVLGSGMRYGTECGVQVN